MCCAVWDLCLGFLRRKRWWNLSSSVRNQNRGKDFVSFCCFKSWQNQKQGKWHRIPNKIALNVLVRKHCECRKTRKMKLQLTWPKDKRNQKTGNSGSETATKTKQSTLMQESKAVRLFWVIYISCSQTGKNNGSCNFIRIADCSQLIWRELQFGKQKGWKYILFRDLVALANTQSAKTEILGRKSFPDAGFGFLTLNPSVPCEVAPLV